MAKTALQVGAPREMAAALQKGVAVAALRKGEEVPAPRENAMGTREPWRAIERASSRVDVT